MNWREITEQHGGVQLSDNRYRFPNKQQGLAAVLKMGGKPLLPPHVIDCQPELSQQGRSLILHLPNHGITEPPPGWTLSKRWLRRVVLTLREPEPEPLPPIESVRRAQQGGWFVRSERGFWCRVSRTEAIDFLVASEHLSRQNATRFIGWCIENPWELVWEPFQPEDLPDCRWNKDAPQFRVAPIPGDHPTWDMIFRHLGTNLSPYVRGLPETPPGWTPGQHYLALWPASCFRQPFVHLPFLFLFSHQLTGKSTYHEAISLLITGGIVRADRAVTGRSEFNGELSKGVIGVIEETEVSRSPQAYARIKDWLTAGEIQIRRMQTDAYQQRNSLHFIMCANSRSACPVEWDDTRITFVEVPDLVDEIPKSILMERLEKEAPAFLHTLLNLELPEPKSRLGVPVIDTPAKMRAKLDCASPAVQAIAELMLSRTQWTGTARDLGELFNEDLSTAIRQFQRQQRLLDQLGIQVTVTDRRAAKGTVIEVEKINNDYHS